MRSLSPLGSAVADLSALAGARFLADIRGAADVLASVGNALEGVVVVEPRTLEIVLNEPSATLLMGLASESAAIVDVTKTAVAAWWTMPNGSGPFRMTT